MTESDWSAPETEVLSSAIKLLRGERKGVLATVIDVEGNAYRRPGAKMVIAEDGEGVGNITAGCLEDEILNLSKEVLEDGKPRVETYDLMEGDDDVWGLGIGCNGVVDILLEPLDETYLPVAEAFEEGRDIGVITVLSSDEGPKSGSRAYYHPGTGLSGTSGFPDWLVNAIEKPASKLTSLGRADTIQIETEEGTAEVFIDGVAAPPELVVFGTGHDVGPVVELAKKNDFRVTVVSFRGAGATEDKFPLADKVLSTSPAQVRENIDFDDKTYAVVMTHNFVDDRLAIDELVRTPVPYIGLMGPRERFEDMMDDFADEGRTFNDEELNKIYTPCGLDLGGGAPYQIAHSIVAEALVVHNGREPRHLRDREGPIHERVEAESESKEGTAVSTTD